MKHLLPPPLTRRSPQRSARGFTVIELMMTLVVMAVLLAIAIPSFTSFIKNTRLYTATNDVQTTLAYARSEAVMRRIPVSVCASADGSTCGGTTWQSGLLVFTDPGNTPDKVDTKTDQLLKYVQFAPGVMKITSRTTTDFNGNLYVEFIATGLVLSGGAGALKLCDDRPGAFGSLVTVYAVGRTEVASNQTCP